MEKIETKYYFFTIILYKVAPIYVFFTLAQDLSTLCAFKIQGFR